MTKASFDPHGHYAAVNAAAAERRAARRAEAAAVTPPPRPAPNETQSRTAAAAAGRNEAMMQPKSAAPKVQGSSKYPDRPQRPGEDIYAWAMDTGRLHPEDLGKTKAMNLPDSTIKAYWTGIRETTDMLASAPGRGRSATPQSDAASSTAAPSPYAINPLVAKAKVEQPAHYAAAMSEGPMPTLFVAGDVPVYVASGADPSLLLKLPWKARHAAARATSAELAQMFERYTGPDGDMAAEMDLGGHGENAAYAQRVQRWLNGLAHDLSSTAPRSAARQKADEENYDALYGAQDRHKAELARQKDEDRATQARRQAEDRARTQARHGR